jgi:hypothetical protein
LLGGGVVVGWVACWLYVDFLGDPVNTCRIHQKKIIIFGQCLVIIFSQLFFYLFFGESLFELAKRYFKEIFLESLMTFLVVLFIFLEFWGDQMYHKITWPCILVKVRKDLKVKKNLIRLTRKVIPKLTYKVNKICRFQ